MESVPGAVATGLALACTTTRSLPLPVLTSSPKVGSIHSERSIPNLQFPKHNVFMLWIVGALTLFVWFILKVLLHKGSGVHILVLFAISCFVTQLVQDLRTRAYRADR